jgi:hypothetical protein
VFSYNPNFLNKRDNQLTLRALEKKNITKPKNEKKGKKREGKANQSSNNKRMISAKTSRGNKSFCGIPFVRKNPIPSNKKRFPRREISR